MAFSANTLKKTSGENVSAHTNTAATLSWRQPLSKQTSLDLIPELAQTENQHADHRRKFQHPNRFRMARSVRVWTVKSLERRLTPKFRSQEICRLSFKPN